LKKGGKLKKKEVESPDGNRNARLSNNVKISGSSNTRAKRGENLSTVGETGYLLAVFRTLGDWLGDGGGVGKRGPGIFSVKKNTKRGGGVVGNAVARMETLWSLVTELGRGTSPKDLVKTGNHPKSGGLRQ